MKRKRPDLKRASSRRLTAPRRERARASRAEPCADVKMAKAQFSSALFTTKHSQLRAPKRFQEKHSHQRLTRCHRLMRREKRRKTNLTHKNRTEVEKIKWGCVQNQTEKHLKKRSVHMCGGFRRERERWWEIKVKERERIPSTQG